MQAVRHKAATKWRQKVLINRGATEFMCAKCLADYYNVDESAVRERMEYFRSTGCTLFDKEP